MPPFVGEPLVMPLEGGAYNILETYWNALNDENRVSLAVKVIDLKSKQSNIIVINRFSKV